MRKHRVLILSLVVLSVGVTAGLVISNGRRAGHAELPADRPALQTTLSDRCGRLIRGDDGEPVVMAIPLVPPPVDEQQFPAITAEPAVENAPARPIAVVPPNSTLYVAASGTCAP